MTKEQIEAYFAGQEKLLVETVSRLVSIDSTEGKPAPGAPFGPGPAAALDEALAIAREWGLTAENHEGYVGTADLNGGEDALHILAHLDVVSPGCHRAERRSDRALTRSTRIRLANTREV